jgi:hypothetical protein
MFIFDCFRLKESWVRSVNKDVEVVNVGGGGSDETRIDYLIRHTEGNNYNVFYVGEHARTCKLKRGLRKIIKWYPGCKKRWSTMAFVKPDMKLDDMLTKMQVRDGAMRTRVQLGPYPNGINVAKDNPDEMYEGILTCRVRAFCVLSFSGYLKSDVSK